jgi:acyl dehydratase
MADPPETSEANPIHGAEGAAAAGYAGALVAGIHTYGWTCTAILEAFGDRWLDDGWADVSYRRPVYPGTLLETTVAFAGEEADVRTALADDGTVVLDGRAGLGRAAWFDQLERPELTVPEPPVPPDELVRMRLADAPVGRDYRPMEVDATVGFGRAWATTRLEDLDSRWHAGDHPRLHPSFLAGRMTPLFRHSYRYGPAIHVRTQIQHLAPARAGQRVVVTARLHAVYERKGHHYHESDCWILGEDGTPLAAKRHTGIFQLGARG